MFVESRAPIGRGRIEGLQIEMRKLTRGDGYIYYFYCEIKNRLVVVNFKYVQYVNYISTCAEECNCQIRIYHPRMKGSNDLFRHPKIKSLPSVDC